MANKTDIMRLLAKGVSQNDICRQLHCGKSTVSACARIIADYALDAEALTELDEASVREGFFAAAPRKSSDDYLEPDFKSVCKRLEVNRKLTLKEIWFQYSSLDPGGKRIYSYSQFCKKFRGWAKGASVTSKMRYVPGQVIFIDWAGDTGTITNRTSGRTQKVYLFVACLPYSALLYAEGFLSTAQEQWLAGHMNALEYIGGVPAVLVPDNCATAVDRSPTFVTQINQTYFDFADHYGCGINPARVGRPRDKNMVESGVDLVEKWIIASLNEDRFYSLEEYNAEVRRKINWLNARPFQQKDGSRTAVFKEEEQETLSRLPDTRFELVKWIAATVAPNSHVKVDYMFYSVPHAYLGRRLDVRKTATKIDVIADGVIVASHARLFGRKAQYSTDAEHMPSGYGAVENPWNPERFIRWAEGIGPSTKEAIERVLASRAIVQQAYVPCQNILGLAKTYGRAQLEVACKRICATSPTPPTYSAIKEECVRRRRRQEASKVTIPDEGGTDRLGDRGRTRGAEHYRLQRGGGL